MAGFMYFSDKLRDDNRKTDEHQQQSKGQTRKSQENVTESKGK